MSILKTSLTFYHNIIFLFIFLSVTRLDAQTNSENYFHKYYGISTGLGISIIHIPDIVDYINSISSNGQRLDDFGIAAEFFAAPELQISDNWGLKLEYSYLIKSYNITSASTAIRQLSCSIHMPTVMIQYILIGEGYLIKLGSGFGYHFANITEEFLYPGTQVYKSSGVGFKMETEGNTKFDENFFGFIGLDFRYNLMNEIKDADRNEIIISNTNKHVNMTFFSIGFKLGFTYYF